jgi:hypothetical protein
MLVQTALNYISKILISQFYYEFWILYVKVQFLSPFIIFIIGIIGWADLEAAEKIREN